MLVRKSAGSFGLGSKRIAQSALTKAANKDILSFVDASREIRRPPLVGMQFLHEGAVSASDVLRGCSRLNSKNLISLLFCHFAPARWAAAVGRFGIVRRVFTPAGLPTVKISGE